VADRLGLTAGLSAAMAPTKQRQRGHDRGDVLVDLAVAIADGATTISDLAVLRNQPELFGEVASHATAWRTLQAIGDDTLIRIRAARADARRHAWAAGADPGFYVIDIDGTLVNSHSDKESASPNYKKRFGFYPIISFLDATGEALACLLRAGNAGSNTAVDDIAVLDDSLAQLPIDPTQVEIIAQTDAAGMTHKYLDTCRERHVRFISGHELSANIAAVLVTLPQQRWQPAISAEGSDWRDYAHVTEITDLVDLTGWPTGTRMIARQEPCHPGRTTHLHRHRRAPLPSVHHRPRRHRRCLPRSALSRPRRRRTPNRRPERHRAHEPALAQLRDQPSLDRDVPHRPRLFAWTQLLGLEPQTSPDDDLTRAEPKRLRYCLLHTAGTIATTGRRRYCRLADTWPWTRQLIAAFERIHRLPQLC
jgi:Transposase DDE domain group 1